MQMGKNVRPLMIAQGTNPSRWGKSYGFTRIQMHRVLNLGWGLGNPASISAKIIEQLKKDGFWVEEIKENEVKAD
jgi:hypothetical protein